MDNDIKYIFIFLAIYGPLFLGFVFWDVGILKF